VEIDWGKPVAEIYNLIRGADPQPGAWTRCNGATLQIFDAARIDGTDAEPGIIAAIDDDGITIGADGGRIRVTRVRPEGGGKIAAAEFAAGRKIAVGARLG
jgi:methionyl-tRNA formyltransferase